MESMFGKTCALDCKYSNQSDLTVTFQLLVGGEILEYGQLLNQTTVIAEKDKQKEC
jgi:hypothetical protein